MSIVTTAWTWAEMIRIGHSVFALPFAVVAGILAGRTLPGHHPAVGQWMLIVLCMVLARSVAMTFNRIVDAELDRRNPRTAQRAIPSGQISVKQAWVFGFVCSMGFILGCSGFFIGYDNFWQLVLSVPVLRLFKAVCPTAVL